ncbi:hypothetical protein SCP_0204070 [Sparassis crispa]|uniref:Uncharacterized protein n=1 Tax=Sparassis crispa TaxID=139825 RepID=A0A401GAL1_9APHY|nr:hypothetical protein SCP_0204070 [Sparassis crispa]GBE79210.1 hypothetical protein SCP_0204070 [Sparassis crispa]
MASRGTIPTQGVGLTFFHHRLALSVTVRQPYTLSSLFCPARLRIGVISVLELEIKTAIKLIAVPARSLTWWLGTSTSPGSGGVITPEV